jgi:hypothetical protein
MTYFISLYSQYSVLGDSGKHPQIRGRFEIRQRHPKDRSRSVFGRPRLFVFDTGAELTCVDEAFAETEGFGDGEAWETFRDRIPENERFKLRGIAGDIEAVSVKRKVRFRDHKNGLLARGFNDLGGIAKFEFDIEFAVILGVEKEMPIVGLRDAHKYFQIGSIDDEYWFTLKGKGHNTMPTDGVHPI